MCRIIEDLVKSEIQKRVEAYEEEIRRLKEENIRLKAEIEKRSSVSMGL